MSAQISQPKEQRYAMMDPAAGRAVIMTLEGTLLHTLEVGRDPIGEPRSEPRLSFSRFLSNREVAVRRNVDPYPYSEFFDSLVHQHQVDQGMGLVEVAVDTDLPKESRREAAQALTGDLFFSRRIQKSVRARLLAAPLPPDWDITASGVEAFEKFMGEIYSHQAVVDVIQLEAELLGFPEPPLDAVLLREVLLEDGYAALVKAAETKSDEPFLTWLEQAAKMSPVLAEEKFQETLKLWSANVLANFRN